MGWLNAIIKTESDTKGWQNFWLVHLVLNRWQRSKTTAVNTAFSLEKLNVQRKSAVLTKSCRYNKSVFVSDGSQ